MAIVDRDGRLFGRLNVVDATAGALLALLLGALVVTWLLPNRPALDIARRKVVEPTLVDVLLPPGREWLAPSIAVGDATYEVETLTREVREVRRIELPGRMEPRVLVTLWVRTGRRPDGVLALGTRPVRRGARFVMHTPGYTMDGVIYDVRPAPP